MKLEQALNQLKNRPEFGIPDPEFVLRTRQMLMARLQELPAVNKVTHVGLISRVSLIVQLLVPPKFAYGMAAFVVFAVSAGAAIAARTALPGQSLYSTKIALEQTHVRFVSNPSERAKVQMEFAGRRLEEARSASPEQESKTLKRFSKEVKQAKNTLKEAADPLQVEAAAAELSKKAREYQEELLKAKSTKSERSVDVAAYEEAADALKEVTGEGCETTEDCAQKSQN